MNIINNNKLKLVNDVLINYDPVHLIAEGAPKDEYLPEAKMIILMMSRVKNEDQLCDLVFECFKKQFPPGFNIGDKLVYRNIAKSILGAL